MIKKLFITLLCLWATALVAGAADGKFVLVIDAGHGGKDTGAPGKISVEKNINLSVALAFGKYVERNCPDVKVVYTRKTDVFIPLKDRANIANKNKANLFISVHTNALDGGKISRGFETYTLGMHRAAENLDVAKRENSVILVEKNYKQSYAGFDPKSAESYIMFELMQDKNMSNSVELAKMIQNEVCANSGRVNKGVHQAGFLVLRETSMPSCLIELGFITTPDEEQFLNSEEGQDKMAYGIYKAFLKYKKKYGNHRNTGSNDDYNDEQETEPAAKQLISEDSENLMAATEYSQQRAVRNQITNDAPANDLTNVEPKKQQAPKPAAQPQKPQQQPQPPKPQQPAQQQPAQSPKPQQPAQQQPAQPQKPQQPAQLQKQPAQQQPAQSQKPQQPAQPQQQPAQQQPAQPPKSQQPVQPQKPQQSQQQQPAQQQPVQPKKTEQPQPQQPAQPQKSQQPVQQQPAQSQKPQQPAHQQPVQPQKTEQPTPTTTTPVPPANPVAQQEQPVAPENLEPGGRPIFKVQIAAMSQEIPTNSDVFHGVEGIEMYTENGMVKYTVGATPDFNEISQLRKTLSAKFPQAFIIAFRDGLKINMAQAMKEYRNYVKNNK
jgi:N-acetylmuramoyl-L-alanine amidase